jgi:hypothetical protein
MVHVRFRSTVAGPRRANPTRQPVCSASRPVTPRSRRIPSPGHFSHTTLRSRPEVEAAANRRSRRSTACSSSPSSFSSLGLRHRRWWCWWRLRRCLWWWAAGLGAACVSCESVGFGSWRRQQKVMDARDARQSFTKRATRDGDAGGAQESSTRLSDAGRGDGALGSGRRSVNR